MNTNPPDPELLSAYADGEVTEAERAQVEQWLAQHPSRRHAVARVHVLGSALRSLPREQLPADFSASLQRQIAELPAPAGPVLTSPGAVPQVASNGTASGASGGPAGGVGWGRRWLPALAASVALGGPLLAWWLTANPGNSGSREIAESFRGPDLRTDGPAPRSSTSPIGAGARQPGFAGPIPESGAGPVLSRAQLKSQLEQAPRDRVQVVTVEFTGTPVDPQLVQAWQQTLSTQLAEQGFRDVSVESEVEGGVGPAATAAPGARRRPVDGSEVETFFVLLEGDVDALVAALEKTIEQSQQEEQIVGWAEAELQWLDEELQQAANSVSAEDPAGQTRKMTSRRNSGTDVAVASDPRAERGRMIVGTAPLQQFGESAEALTAPVAARQAPAPQAPAAPVPETAADSPPASVPTPGRSRRSPAGEQRDAPGLAGRGGPAQRLPERSAGGPAGLAASGAASEESPGHSLAKRGAGLNRMLKGAAPGAAPGAAAKASVEPGEPVADADHPQPAAQALSETRRVLIQVRMPPVGTPASSLSPAAAAPDQAPASKAAPAPEPVPAPQNP